MLNDLIKEDEDLYTMKGLLQMLKRNMTVKRSPERFQETELKFDLVVTFEERVFEIIVAEFSMREPELYQPVHILNMNVIDNHEQSIIGARDAYNLYSVIKSEGENWKDKIDSIIEKFEDIRPILHSVQYY